MKDKNGFLIIVGGKPVKEGVNREDKVIPLHGIPVATMDYDVQGDCSAVCRGMAA